MGRQWFLGGRHRPSGERDRRPGGQVRTGAVRRAAQDAGRGRRGVLGRRGLDRRQATRSHDRDPARARLPRARLVRHRGGRLARHRSGEAVLRVADSERDRRGVAAGREGAQAHAGRPHRDRGGHRRRSRKGDEGRHRSDGEAALAGDGHRRQGAAREARDRGRRGREVRRPQTARSRGAAPGEDEVRPADLRSTDAALVLRRGDLDDPGRRHRAQARAAEDGMRPRAVVQDRDLGDVRPGLRGGPAGGRAAARHGRPGAARRGVEAARADGARQSRTRTACAGASRARSTAPPRGTPPARASSAPAGRRSAESSRTGSTRSSSRRSSRARGC